MTGPEDRRAAADRGRLRAAHADREQVIGALKTAFVDGRLTKDELDARAAQAFGARTVADLAKLTADIPAGRAAAPLARPAAPAHRRPLARAAVKAVICLIIAAAAWWVASIADPGPRPSPYQSWAAPLVLLATIAVFTAVGIVAHGVVTSWQLRRSRRQPPPGPGPTPGTL